VLDPVDGSALQTQLESQGVTQQQEQIGVGYLFFSQMPTGWKDTELDGTEFRSATVTLDEFGRPTVQINFNDEGAQLFQQLTASNIGKQIAIFVGGELISAPTVQAEIAGGTAVITGTYSIQEARLLAQDLNTGAIPAPIFLSGQRTIEPTLGATALQTSLKAALIGVFVLMVYMLFMYRLLGLLANIALVGYALILFALLKLPLFLVSDQYIVLSLAGMAGIILSIGMAVDANVLIFERMREELRKGKSVSTAASTGFTRAWPSIRDGNVSTLITCAILFIIGTSIIKGFAITLGLGVAISMFSAIVITRYLTMFISKTALGKRTELFL
jgi:preprotein translocase subunit SecD